MSVQSELHNKLTGEIVRSIIQPVLETGGSYPDIMVITESVVVGVVLACARIGADEKILKVMMHNVTERLADIRFDNLQVEGRC